MEAGNILAVLGIVVSLGFGVWGVLVVLRRAYPGRIAFACESSIGLFDSIVKDLPDLSITYKGSPVGEGLVLLKGVLVNTGSKDIAGSMVVRNLSLELPDGYRWVNAHITESSEDVRASLSLSERSITFDTGLFRCEEYIRFQALAEVPRSCEGRHGLGAGLGDLLASALSFKHRIADTEKVRRFNLEADSGGMMLGIFFGLMSGIVFLTTIWYLATGLIAGWPAKVSFLVPVDSGKTIEMKVQARTSGMIRVSGQGNEEFEREFPAEEFFALPNLKPKLVMNWPDVILAIVVCPLSLLGFLGMLGRFLSQRRSRKFRRILAIGRN